MTEQSQSEQIDSTKAIAERLIAWGSIAYACGFVIVLLHTARIGIPVLDLLKPIYVWIGLPVAITLFFARRILGLVRARAAANKAELLRAWKSDSARNPLEATDQLIDTVGYITPWYLPRKTIQRFYRRTIDRIVEVRSRSSDHAEITKTLDLYARGFRGFNASLKLFRLALSTILGVGLILLYVWGLYPRIPQAYGGGAPTTVRLLVDAAKLPPGLPDLTGAASSGEIASVPAITAEVNLLYIASASYWIRGRTGEVIALDKSVVMGIVYPEVRRSTSRTRR